jgi:hypothetical protein
LIRKSCSYAAMAAPVDLYPRRRMSIWFRLQSSKRRVCPLNKARQISRSQRMIGAPYMMLKRHLRRHGLDPDSYRARYGLPADYPMVAPRLRMSFPHGLLPATSGAAAAGRRTGRFPIVARSSLGSAANGWTDPAIDFARGIDLVHRRRTVHDAEAAPSSAWARSRQLPCPLRLWFRLQSSKRRVCPLNKARQISRSQRMISYVGRSNHDCLNRGRPLPFGGWIIIV